MRQSKTYKQSQWLTEGPEESAALKADQAREVEDLKRRHEDEVEALKMKHERESDRQGKKDEAEAERDQQEDTLPDIEDSKYLSELEEGKLVADDMMIIDSAIKSIKQEMVKSLKKSREAGVSFINSMFRSAGLKSKVSAKMQAKGRLFLKQELVKEDKEEQDRDVKHKDGTQPKKYYKGLDKKTKDARDAHFKKGKTGPAPGDSDAKTKPSVHTKKFKAMFGENADKGLKNKAEKSGISLGILKQVYDRGLAAYKTGHRPGATAPQWAMARVNSFITKGKGTWGGADKDLAAKVKG